MGLPHFPKHGVPSALQAVRLAIAWCMAATASVCLCESLPLPLSPEKDFIDGLIERRLFPLAILACEERLSREDLSALDRAESTVDLSRSYAAWALQSGPRHRTEHWRQAEAVLQKWSDRYPKSGLTPLITRQSIQIALARGTFARQISHVTLQSESNHNEGIAELKRCIDLAKGGLVKVKESLLGSTPSQTQKNHLGEEALLLLQDDFQKSEAAAWIELALCYQEDSPDQIHAVQQAERLLKPLAAQENPIDWDSRVAHLTCLRLSGDKKLFEKAVDILKQSNLPVDVRGKLRCQLAKQLIADEQYMDAIELLNRPIHCNQQIEAELDLIELKLLLAAAATASGVEENEWNRRAVHQLELIESLHDPYWSLRARILLGKSIATGGAKEVSLLIRAAEGLYQSGQVEDAVASYDQAENIAATGGDALLAFTVGRTAAAIESKQKNYREASRRFLRLAETYPQNEAAAQIHLLGIYNLAQAMREDATSSDTETAENKEYRTLLEQHLKRWPGTTTSNRARFWLGRLFAAEGKSRAASELFFAIPPESPVYAAAVAAAVPCCEQQCRATFSQFSSGQCDARQFIQSVENILAALVPPAGQLLEQNNALAPKVAGDTAQLQMRYLGCKYTSALNLIERALRIIGPSSEKEKKQLHQLQIEALFGSGDVAKARQQIARFDGSWVDLIFGLHQVTDGVRLLSREAGINRREAASLKLDAFAGLKKSAQKVDEKDRIALRLIEANALRLTGKAADSLTIIRTLAEAHPNDGRVQRRYAELLLQQPDDESLQMALKKYREIVRRSPPQTNAWFSAKYGQAKSQFKLGNAARAAQMVRMLRVLHPELGGTELRKRFEKLLAECNEKIANP